MRCHAPVVGVVSSLYNIVVAATVTADLVCHAFFPTFTFA